MFLASACRTQPNFKLHLSQGIFSLFRLHVSMQQDWYWQQACVTMLELLFHNSLVCNCLLAYRHIDVLHLLPQMPVL